MLYTLLRCGRQSPDQNEAFGPAPRETFVEFLKSIGANQSADQDVYFDNHEPGIKYLLLKLKPIG